MARQIIDIGVQGNDGTGDSIRESFRKVNENFTQLFAIFGDGDRIAFTDLDDTPDGYLPDQVIVSNETGDALVAKNLIGGDGILIDHTDPNQIRVVATGGKLEADDKPKLSNHMNADGYVIAHTREPSPTAAQLFENLHGVATSEDDIVITKGYADKKYLQTTGSSSVGSLVRIRNEPPNTEGYTITVDEWVDGYAFIPDHGFNNGINGAAWVYDQTGNFPADGLIKGQTYYFRYYNSDLLGIYGTKEQAIDDVNFEVTRIIVNDSGVPKLITSANSSTITGTSLPNTFIYNDIPVTTVTGIGSGATVSIVKNTTSNAYDGTNTVITFIETGLNYALGDTVKILGTYLGGATPTNDLTFDLVDDYRGDEYLIDAGYDSSLAGNWLADEAIQRRAVVRRQGDDMEGALFLHDHPGALAGVGTPNGPDDLQAATKFYVDSSSFASFANLFVATSGDDAQPNTPPGKEGRSLAYAYATIGAACSKAEEIIAESLLEPGPYRQQMTYLDNTFPAYVESISPGAGAERTLSVYTQLQGVDQSIDVDNRDLREGSIIKGLRSGATGKVIQYIPPAAGQQDKYVVELLHTTTDVTTFQTGYLHASERLISNLEFIGEEVIQYISSKYPAFEYDSAKCKRDTELIITAVAFDVKYGGNKRSIEAGRSYWRGVTSVLPSGQMAETLEGIDYALQLADQIIQNIEVPAAPDPISFGKRGTIAQDTTTGAVGEAGSFIVVERMVNLIKDIIENGPGGSGEFLEFLDDEYLEFGQPVPEVQISIRVESGVYYEQLPIRVPTNVSIKGDEFRRSIIRPAPGQSTSPWTDIFFRRDSDFDGIVKEYRSDDGAASSSGDTVTLSSGDITGKVKFGMNVYLVDGDGILDSLTTVTDIIGATSFKVSPAPTTALSNATIRILNASGVAPTEVEFGYHYLKDPTGLAGIFDTTIAKTADNNAAAALMVGAKSALQTSVVSYINSTYGSNFMTTAQKALCARDVGLIVDAIVYDITYGGTSRTENAGHAYRRNPSARVAITTQLVQTIDAMDKLKELLNDLLVSYDPSRRIVEDLVTGIQNIILAEKNPAKDNKDMDVFLLNDGCILRNITCQGHGGFMCVLDPEGQIQTKSPYFQTCTSLSGSTNEQRFAGGMLIDGFCGNLPGFVVSRTSSTQLQLGGLIYRKPLVPTSFYVAGARYQINAIDNWDPIQGTADVVLDASTPYAGFNETKCSRDVGLILDAIGYDMVLGSNYQSVKAGLSYLRSYSSVVTSSQLNHTVAGIEKARDLAIDALAGNATAIELVTENTAFVTNILRSNSGSVPAITYPDSIYSAANTNLGKARDIIVANKNFIKEEITSYVATLLPIPNYNEAKCARDVGYVVDALVYDLMYGGNSQTKDVVEAYFRDGVSYIPGEESAHALAYTRLKLVLGYLVVNDDTSWTVSPGNTLIQDTSLPAATSAESTLLGTLSDIIIDYVADGDYDTTTTTVLPTTIGEALLSAQATITSNKAVIQTAVIDFLNEIEIETPGNRSMLSNDFTQVNDLGYGLVATNNGISEAVSEFTYYNWTSYYALNGGQIRSVTGSSCNGVYGLRAKGSDPREIPDVVTLGDATLQQAKIYSAGSLLSKNKEGDATFYIEGFWYQPFGTSEVEIDHTPKKSSLIETSLEITSGGLGYTVDDLLTVTGGTTDTPTLLVVTEVDGGVTGGPGVITGVQVADPGVYTAATPATFTDSPVGVYPTTAGTINVTGGTGTVAATFSGSYLGTRAIYEISTIEETTLPTVLKLNLDTAGAAGGSAPALVADLFHNQIITIRALQNLRFTDVAEVRPVRPSTALEFIGPASGGQVLRTLNYNLSSSTGDALPANQAVLNFDQNVDYVLLDVKPDSISGGYGSAAGDDKLAIVPITGTKLARVNSGELIFPHDGRMHLITGYTEISPTVGYITFTDLPFGEGTTLDPSLDLVQTGLRSGFTDVRNTTIRAGLQAGTDAKITVRISTCRATGHDFLDVGSGGFNSTNYPNNLYGAPKTPPNKENEVIEETQGRVFYVSTDQNGIFKVGKFFEVDQGTGNVTFNAAITLTDLNGLGFKKGTFVTEFSTETGLSDNDPNTVPTEFAVRSYIDRRLGLVHDTNDAVPDPIGPGYLPLNGSIPFSDDLDMGGGGVPHKIINIALPGTDGTAAANKNYVDTEVAKYDSLEELKDVNLMTPAAGDVALFTGSKKVLMSGGFGGDLSATLDSTYKTTLVGGITTSPTIDSGIIGTSQTNVSGGIVVANITGFPASGYIQIGSEVFSYTSITSGSNRFDNVTRARFETTAATHAALSEVKSLDAAFINLQLVAGAISNNDINASASIDQSKLNLTDVTDYVDIATTATVGIASFSSDNFAVTAGGEVTIKNSGVALAEIQNITAGTILGNLTESPAAPQEVTTNSLVSNGINSLFSSVDAGANVLTRRVNGLKTSPSSTFSAITGTPANSSGTQSDVPVTAITGTGNGAKVTVTWVAGIYTAVTVTYGGNGYAEGNQLRVDGRLLGGTSPTNDINFTVSTTGSNIDTTVYLGLQRVTVTAEADSIVKTDNNRNLGTAGNKFNNVYSNTFTGTATAADNLSGGTLGDLPYQGAAGDTTFLSPGANGYFLKSNGAGSAPTWAAVPSGAAADLSGDTLAAGVVNSSLTSVGTLTSLVVSGITQGSVATGLTALGTTQGTALALTKQINVVTDVPVNTGVVLPASVPGARIIIRNAVAESSLKVYPPSGAQINTLGTNSSYPLTEGGLEFVCESETQWFTLTATFGG